MTISKMLRPRAALRLLLFLGALGGCGPDETLELFPDGGAGGAGGQLCDLHADCTGNVPWCDAGAEACVACPDALMQCGAECVDRTRDARHCGDCFAPCNVGEVCHQGTCACAPGLTLCGSTCVDTQADPAHCNACDHPCDAGTACIDGGCHAVGCEGGLTACDDGAGHLACVDLLHGPRCGSCDVVCGPHEVCVAGACKAQLPATPCAACPCDHECHAALGEAVCCDGVLGEPGPSCVAGSSCP